MSFRFITPTIHGILDYTAALALIIAPFMLPIRTDSEFVHWFSIAAGIGLITYSLFTDYRFSMKGVFSYKNHLLLDMTASIAFIVLAFLHQGSMLTFSYCLIMGGGVLVVIGLSKNQQTND
ncbi:hypothetical protein D5R81_09660 [Parashewanella spongiae]|uniref:Transporter n=1 Tax=Parashewanella spongiae TaxID=342950 RepID=A0A3A6TX91_9GAMM|nr:hypothetical protein [Parashewanella spongiae]MCL1078141.1 hypothetical protein [Parashewanella spongiae]RJY16346.1 hypothetical protein D5R81_09660 [Parashewanella spongiae]